MSAQVYVATLLPISTGLQNTNIGTIAISVNGDTVTGHDAVVAELLQALGGADNFFNANLVNLANTGQFSISP